LVKIWMANCLSRTSLVRSLISDCLVIYQHHIPSSINDRIESPQIFPAGGAF
jgi:hypothetical protein